MPYIYCTTCKGKKRLIGLGMIAHDCASCLGTGYEKEAEVKPGVEEAPLIVTAQDITQVETTKITKKRTKKHA